MDRSGPKVKSFDISKRLIAGAWEKVQANGGAPGMDAVSISLFKDDEINNLYKLWNRMSAGSYMPGRANSRSLSVIQVTLGSHELECPDLVAADPFRGFLDGVHVFYAE